ncbi:MAG: FadR/GntR family transcriptional regulator [Propionivibrio sp.]
MPIESHDTCRLFRNIAEQINDSINSGQLKPGQRLPAERVLAKQLGVSRPTLREALIALEVEGRVEIRGGAGVYVLDRARVSAPDAILEANGVQMPSPFEVVNARDLVESEIAALAAKNATDLQIRKMSQALGDMACCLATDPLHIEYDRRFHLALAEASGNNALFLTSQLLWNLREQPIYLQLEVHFHTEAIWQKLILEHREILAGVKSKDPKAARAAMHRHMKNTMKRFSSSWQEG